MKWNAWGDPEAAEPLSKGIRSLLRQALGVGDSPVTEPEIDEVRVRPSTLSAADRVGLAEIVGEGHIAIDDRSRLLHAGGKSTLDLLRRKGTGTQDAP
ncbi:MAG: alkyldihydroxyacetonephosphate synthase, partial [Mycobacterium sp.]|nr:alkyldihydroxyacetonephosphate synthase [Mycobacterium sp.]